MCPMCIQNSYGVQVSSQKEKFPALSGLWGNMETGTWMDQTSWLTGHGSHVWMLLQGQHIAKTCNIENSPDLSTILQKPLEIPFLPSPHTLPARFPHLIRIHPLHPPPMTSHPFHRCLCAGNSPLLQIRQALIDGILHRSELRAHSTLCHAF